MLDVLKNPSTPISQFMHASPETIAASEVLGKALLTMQERRIRHLPVLRDGELVGILSDREANLVRLLPNGLSLMVSDVMTSPVFSVHEDESLESVVAVMAAKKYGAVIVQNGNGDVVGIFTVTDAMNLLHIVLQT